LNEIKLRTGYDAAVTKSKRIMVDMLINLVGTGFPLVVLQLIIYPIVAQKISVDAYGQMQSAMSLVYLVGGTLGGALSTTRLIRAADYRENDVCGDYPFLLWGSAALAVILVPIIARCVLGIHTVTAILLTTVIAVLNLLLNYVEVGFRLSLDYRGIFINKILTCAGYLLGFGLFWYTLKWEFVFVGSYLAPLLHCVCKTNLIRERFVTTKLFRRTCKAFSDLNISTLLNKVLTYFDKLVLYPLLGGEAVAVYFAANIFGKLVIQVLEPITNVILSYLSREKSVSDGVWKMTVLTGAGFCAVMYFGCRVISGPILSIFYPQWAEQAMELIPIATLSLCISSFISILRPLTLKALTTSAQIIINGVSVISYIGAMLFLVRSYGLMGACIALLFSYVVKLIVILAYCLWSKYGNNEKR